MSDRVSQFLGLPLAVSLIQGKLPENYVDAAIDVLRTDLNVLSEDLLVLADFDLEAYHEVLQFCSSNPFGELKLVVINLTGASTKSQQALSFILESPLRKVKFVLFSEMKLTLKLASRCQILNVYSKFSPEAASKTRVLKALASASLGEKKILRDTLTSWQPEDTETLKLWAFECISQRYEEFSSEEIQCLGLTQDFATALLEALEALRGADYKRAVTTLLMAQIASTNGAL